MGGAVQSSTEPSSYSLCSTFGGVSGWGGGGRCNLQLNQALILYVLHFLNLIPGFGVFSHNIYNR